jgi:hypothetical protein
VTGESLACDVSPARGNAFLFVAGVRLAESVPEASGEEQIGGVSGAGRGRGMPRQIPLCLLCALR